METLFGLPLKVEFCQKCVISNQRPSSTIEFQHHESDRKKTISFEDGVCAACRYNEQKNKLVDWETREKRLLQLLDKFRRNDGRYDVIVPGSGGKDSAYTAHILKYKYGMNPLTVTWAPHLYTNIGWENFQNWMHIGGLDNILFTPNGRVHRYLTRLATLNLLHPFQPFIVGQRLIGPRFSTLYDVPLVMYGENQAEYGNAIEENLSPKMDQAYFTQPDLKNVILGGCSLSSVLNETKFSITDFAPYLPPTADKLSASSVEVHYLGYYLKWDPQECFYYAAENTGFKENTERTQGSYSKYSSIDDKIDPFHYYTTLVKFGIGRATYDAAQEIRNEKIEREEGVALVKKFDTEFPNKYFKEFLDYIDLSEGDFWALLDRFRSPHLWAKDNGGDWKLRHAVWH